MELRCRNPLCKRQISACDLYVVKKYEKQQHRSSGLHCFSAPQNVPKDVQGSYKPCLSWRIKFLSFQYKSSLIAFSSFEHPSCLIGFSSLQNLSREDWRTNRQFCCIHLFCGGNRNNICQHRVTLGHDSGPQRQYQKRHFGNRGGWMSCFWELFIFLGLSLFTLFSAVLASVYLTSLPGPASSSLSADKALQEAVNVMGSGSAGLRCIELMKMWSESLRFAPAYLNIRSISE